MIVFIEYLSGWFVFGFQVVGLVVMASHEMTTNPQPKTRQPDRLIMKLIFNDGFEVNEGDLVHCFRGDEYIVTGWREPHKVSSTGRVYVNEFDEDGENTRTGEYFPGVFDMKFVSDDEYKQLRIDSDPEAHGLKFPE